MAATHPAATLDFTTLASLIVQKQSLAQTRSCTDIGIGQMNVPAAVADAFRFGARPIARCCVCALLAETVASALPSLAGIAPSRSGVKSDFARSKTSNGLAICACYCYSSWMTLPGTTRR